MDVIEYFITIEFRFVRIGFRLVRFLGFLFINKFIRNLLV